MIFLRVFGFGVSRAQREDLCRPEIAEILVNEDEDEIEKRRLHVVLKRKRVTPKGDRTRNREGGLASRIKNLVGLLFECA